MQNNTLPNAGMKVFIQWLLDHQIIFSEPGLVFWKTPVNSAKSQLGKSLPNKKSELELYLSPGFKWKYFPPADPLPRTNPSPQQWHKMEITPLFKILAY